MICRHVCRCHLPLNNFRVTRHTHTQYYHYRYQVDYLSRYNNYDPLVTTDQISIQLPATTSTARRHRRLTVHRPRLTVHRPRLTVHRPRLTVHRPRLTVHRPHLTVHSPQTLHSPQAASHSSQTASHSSQARLTVHRPRLTVHRRVSQSTGASHSPQTRLTVHRRVSQSTNASQFTVAPQSTGRTLVSSGPPAHGPLITSPNTSRNHTPRDTAERARAAHLYRYGGRCSWEARRGWGGR